MNIMSAITFQAAPMRTQAVDPTEGPRKRRKRAPATGAANDCFTCQNRNVKCSRGRPYCSQCLEAGQDCAGYKTQLTWGVGVASRGKLRGLSTPVAGTKKVTDPTSPPKSKRRPSPVNTKAISIPPSDPTASLSPEIIRHRPSDVAGHPAGPGISLIPHNEFVHHSLPRIEQVPASHGYTSDSLHRPATTSSPINVGWTTPGSLPNHAYQPPQVSPLSYSAPHDGHYFDGSASVRHDTYHSPSNPYPVSSNLAALMNPVFPMTETFPSYATAIEHYNDADIQHPLASVDIASAAQSGVVLFSEDDVEEVVRDVANDEAISDTLSVSSAPLVFDMNLSYPPFSGISSVGRTPRMQYLIQYYAEVIAPVIVAFDSPSNPFRDQILSLAAKNEGLQHAISALAASNMRQRRECGALSTGKTLPARRSSAAHLSLTNEAWYDAPLLPPREQKREEVFHKYYAVKALNNALANHSLRKDDSVLATLLVLCLFHICDSGIARFQTQFAGVKKLLSLRQSEGNPLDNSTKWMTRLFTLFDAMAATVNEREGQFDSHHLDSSAVSDCEWSYETLAGVDGRLFKIMSKLGRLNILSQGRPVEETQTLVSRPAPVVGLDHGAFDGNGWMRIVEDEDFFTSKTADVSSQEQFWREWREIRQALQTWNTDSVLYGPGNLEGPQLTDDQRVDVDNISNAFRYSALLYTERLGNPQLVSSDEKIQYWVRRALHHIKQVRSDVYLLWPLFITGSECVHEEGRNIIRERCLDIQKDSGFVNNASCLALLEKVWSTVPVVGTNLRGSPVETHDPQPHQPDEKVNGFRFRDVMLAEGNEGEWIVV